MAQSNTNQNKSDLIELTRGVPPVEAFPTAQLGECALTALEKYGKVVLQYANSRGFLPLRQQIARENGVNEDHVIIGQGSLQLLDHLLRSFNEGNLTLAVEEPTYDRTLTLMKRVKADILTAPIEGSRTDLSKIEKHLRKGKNIDYFYVIPDFQNPTGRVMPLADRKKIVDLAREFNFLIIEDSPYRKLQYSGDTLPSCYELAPDAVILLSSYSKLISPGLRVGYMILPTNLYARVAKVAEDTYINPSYFNQAIVYEFCSQGLYDKHLATLKELYGQRCTAMLTSLEQDMSDLAEWPKPNGGFFIGANVKVRIDISRLFEAAAAHQLKLTDGRGFFMSGGDQFIRLPFCALTPTQIAEGISRLASTLKSLSAGE